MVEQDGGTAAIICDAQAVLTGADLTIADVEAVARHGARAALDVHARERMREARGVIDALVAEGAVVYGVTTGFGDLATTFVPPERSAELQRRLLMSHAAGVGPAFPREVVRAMLLLRAQSLAMGMSGVRLVAGGGPLLEGASMSARRQDFRARYDWIRTGLCFEPRGHDMMSGGFHTSLKTVESRNVAEKKSEPPT